MSRLPATPQRRNAAPRLAAPGLTVSLIVALSALVAGGCAEGAAPISDVIGGDTSEPTDTTNTDVPSGDTDVPPGCLPTACQIGTSVCGGNGAIITCVDDGNGCGTLGSPVACGLSEVCEEGACQPFVSCVDGDGDGYGPGCTNGEDCDDARFDVHPGASELCGDKIDNDCANGVDDGCPDPCAGSPCQPPSRRCSADGTGIEECVADIDGCGTWGTAVACGGACANGECQGCVDNDSDGRGQGCALGDDCDDSDPDRFTGNAELCDGVDNNCDGNVDEPFSNKGMSCTAGQGACQSSGTFVCAADKQGTVCDATAGTPQPERCGDNIDSDCDGNPNNGFGTIGDSCSTGSGSCTSTGTIECDAGNTRQTRCNAPAPTGSPEICDGQDNDCNGTADNGNVCNACTDDSREHNDKSSTASTLNNGTVGNLMLCPGDHHNGDTADYVDDWYLLGTVPVSADIEIQHPTGNNGAGQPWSNLNVEAYCGASYCGGMYGSATRQVFSSGSCVNPCPSGERYAIRVYADGDAIPASGTPYTLIRR